MADENLRDLLVSTAGLTALAGLAALRHWFEQRRVSRAVELARSSAEASAEPVVLLSERPPPAAVFEPDALSRRLLLTLHESARVRAISLLELADSAGVRLAITSALRTHAEQARLYAQGRTTPGPRVTGAQPGQSWHNYGLAFDVAPLRHGRPHWPNDMRLWSQIGELGERLGLEWGGRWKQRDLPHFQFRGTPPLSLADAARGHRPAV